MATQLLSVAFDDAFDTAMLVSADSDLTTPVVRVRQRFPNKRIIVVPPPGRQSVELTRAANGYFHIGEDKLRHCQANYRRMSPAPTATLCNVPRTGSKHDLQAKTH